MLCELRVKNLALIESLELVFDQRENGGLVVMTGETGAGKSIMLRAIHLLSGGRGSSDWIRSGAESCEIEAMFEINLRHRLLLEKLDKGGFGNESTLVIRRLVSRTGRSRFYVNGFLATGKIVSELSTELISVASQHDHQQLLQPSVHLDLLDTMGDLWDDRQQLGSSHGRWQRKKAALQELQQQEQEKEQRQDFLRYQVSEIKEAALKEGEDELLLAEKKRLKNSESLISLSQATQHLLSGELMDSLTTLRMNMVQLATLDPELSGLTEEITGYTFLAEDFVAGLKEYRATLDRDPYRLEQLTERLDLIQQLKRKYGIAIEDILTFARQGEEELRRLDSMDKEIAALEKELGELEEEMCGQAKLLSEKRLVTMAKLERVMGLELSSLAFNKATFRMVLKDVERTPENLRASGWERGEFFFSANPGEPLKPLAKIASGGELSRLMLAMKCLLARKDMVETVIFDEVDAGIGGEAAEAVARKIQELSVHHQVFCITHLPQIAARGSLHFQVSKKVDDGRTQTEVVPLSPDLRLGELVRMLAGDSATEQTRAWAKQLLANGGG